MRALILIGLLASCGGDETYMVVTVDKRPAVHDAVKLEVKLTNNEEIRGDSFGLGDAEFPATFSISATGRTGDLEISIDALDAQGAQVGHGSATVDATATSATVMLDSSDFVVNALYANNQFLSNDFEAVGLQLGALTNGTWMATFREDCTQCFVLGRRFDATGIPVRSELAAGDTQFQISTLPTTSGSVPAIATSGLTTLVVWDYFDNVNMVEGIACRAIDEQGAGVTDEVTLFTDEAADVATIAPLSNGNFALTWQTFMTTQVIRGLILKPDCTPLAARITISTDSGTFGARRSHVAANGTSVLYAWVVDGAVHMRYGANNGALLGTESTPIPATVSQEVDHVRIAPWGTGFAAVVRWAATSGTGPGKIEVYRIPATGTAPMVMGTPILITDKSGSDFASDKAFGVAPRSDGALMVAWHACETGPGSCDVFGRILRPTGAAVGNEFVLATTTGSDQVNPSIVALDDKSFVAAWNDSSGIPPDQSGSSVRARILYPVYDDARGVLGATCGPSAPGAPDCNDGLACAMGSDSVHRCYAKCTPPTCPGGGTCSTVDELTSACTF